MRKITKLFTTKATSINEESKTVRFRISDNQPDRMGEIVDQKSWDFKSYLKNPIILWGHNPDEPENVLGTAQTLEIAGDGSYTEAELRLDADFNPKAALVFNQLKAGTLNCVSVGFIPHSEEYKDDTPVLKDNELLEISIVPIPANPRAVALSLKEGSLSRKDAKWMLESMRKESDLLEAELKAQDIKQEKKTMTEEQAQALIDGMVKLTETVEAVREENAALKEEVAALKPPVETEAEKQAREAKEAEEAEAARKAKEEANKEDPAKSGDNDQDGAEVDELDEDAELTPEQEAEAREALGLPAEA